VLDSDLSKNGQKKVLKAEVDYVNVGNVSAKDWNLAKKTEIDNAQPDTKIKTEKFTVDTDGYKYEATVKYPLVRVYKNSSGTILGYSMIQPAEIDIKLKEKDTKNSSEKLTASCKHSAVASPDFSEIKSFSGLSSGKKLVVKAVAKHPYAAYNRGNEDYVVNEDDITDIYVLSGEAGTVTVDETPVLSDFKRGDDYIFTGSWDWGSLRTVYSGTEGALFRYYRTDIGSSSANYYYKALESGSTIKINAAETLALLPQYEYILEFIPIFKDDNSLTYPINSSLAAAIGLSEGWASGTTQMDFSEYGKRYKIPAATMTLSIENDESNPYVFNGISEANIRFDLSNIEVGHFSDSYYKMYLERKDGDNWVSCTTTPARTYGNIEVKRNGSDMSIYLSQNNVISNGLYRARIVIDKAAFREITGTTFDYTTSSSSEDAVYDRYIYIKINKQ
jgi:hypothetical protein